MATDQQVKIVINGEDKSKPAFASAQSNVSGLSKGLSSMANVVAGGLLAAGAGLTAFLYSSAKAAGEAEVAMARVDTILKTMGDSALANKDAILSAANAAVKLGFDDEAAAESMTRLYQRTNDLTEAQKLSALAMDLARAKSIDLSAATDLIGQVLSGNSRVLKQFGIELDETLGPMAALAQLQQQVAGQSEAFSGTFQGQMQVLNESVNNLKETIGGALLEAIMPFIKQLSDWARNPDVQEKVKAVASAIGHWASVVLPVAVDAITLLFKGLKFLYDLLVDFEVKMFSVIDTIGKFIAKAGQIAGAVGGGIKSAASATANFITAPFRADGGPVTGGSPYIVGERGPELFVPNSSGSVIPNGGYGAITINISGNTLLDDDAGYKIGQQIMNALKTQIRI